MYLNLRVGIATRKGSRNICRNKHQYSNQKNISQIQFRQLNIVSTSKPLWNVTYCSFPIQKNTREISWNLYVPISNSSKSNQQNRKKKVTELWSWLLLCSEYITCIPTPIFHVNSDSAVFICGCHRSCFWFKPNRCRHAAIATWKRPTSRCDFLVVGFEKIKDLGTYNSSLNYLEIFDVFLSSLELPQVIWSDMTLS